MKKFIICACAVGALILVSLTACQPDAPVVTPYPATPTPVINTPTPVPMMTAVPAITAQAAVPAPTPIATPVAAAPATPSVTPEPRWYIAIEDGKLDRFTEHDYANLPSSTSLAAPKGEDIVHEYTGVLLVDVLNYCGVPTGTELKVNSGNGLTYKIPVEYASSPNTMLALTKDGKPLSLVPGDVMLVVDDAPKDLWIETVVKISIP